MDKLSDEQLCLMISELESRIANRLSCESARLNNAQSRAGTAGEAAIWRRWVAEEEPQDATCSAREGAKARPPVGRDVQDATGGTSRS
jgi:hypothetical protein